MQFVKMVSVLQGIVLSIIYIYRLVLQKLLFLDTAEGVANAHRPYWSEAIKDRASVVQTQPDMLEIVPPGTSKGSGVQMLLDHLGVTPKEVWANSS